ncbi:hypothetical protein QBC38DRAFT_481885 [Podospora fimiseda]|uniref:MICOS complex subunit MIC12 n=1 Tax=Podospora fimiseda TaxID=252190 RepID=A0AAN7BLR0_9PEZI|nr:hypothetical protein QBC38DRAFT_481885 [Podospora fimiseda]
MGFIRRLAGSTILTAGLTIYALNRARQPFSQQSDPIIPLHKKQRNTIINPDGTYIPRDTLSDTTSQFVENIKARWNQEIINLVKWTQGVSSTEPNWEAVDKAAQFTKEKSIELGHTSQEKIKEGGKWMKEAGKQAYEGAFELEKKALLGVHEIEKKVEGVVEGVKRKEGEWMKKGKEVYGKVKANVYLAEEKVESKVEAKLLGVGEIEKVLGERYDWKKREDRLDKSVEETLAERYLPVEKRENRLRWL